MYLFRSAIIQLYSSNWHSYTFTKLLVMYCNMFLQNWFIDILLPFVTFIYLYIFNEPSILTYDYVFII